MLLLRAALKNPPLLAFLPSTPRFGFLLHNLKKHLYSEQKIGSGWDRKQKMLREIYPFKNFLKNRLNFVKQFEVHSKTEQDVQRFPTYPAPTHTHSLPHQSSELCYS